MFGIKRNSTLLAMAVLGIAAVAPAHAGWNGPQAATMSGTDPFSVVGNIVTITAGGTQSITSAGQGWTNATLLGIRSIWIISPTNTSIIRFPLAGTGNGFATNGTNTVNWVIDDNGWDSGDSGAGLPAGSNRGWISMQPASVMSSYNKLTNPLYNSGSFTFTGLSGLIRNTDYRIGLDVLVAPTPGSSSTATGRIYLNGGTNGGGNGQTGTSGNGGNPVPEPGEWAAMGVLSAGLMGLVAKSRRRRAA